MKKHLLAIGTILLFLSILAISRGAYLQANSTQFDFYQQTVMNDMAARHPGDALAPELGIGLVLASAWSVVGFIQWLICMFFLVGLLCVRNHRIRFGNRSPYIFTALFFMIFCVISSIHYAYIAFDSFTWNFHVRGIGELIAAIGLLAVTADLILETDLQSLLNIVKWKAWRTKHTHIP